MRKKSSWIWSKVIDGNKIMKAGFKTEREAAVALDKAMIERGLKPINIFIKK